MASPHVPIYGLDIETDTSTDGLDPRVSRVVAVAVADAGGVRVFDDRDEALLLDRVDWHLAALEPGVIATWNGSAFDLPYLADRAASHGVPLGLHLTADRAMPCRQPALPGHPVAYRAHWYGHTHLDAYRLYRADTAPALGVSASLKSIARVCGLDPVEVDSAAIHLLDAATVRDYVASDAHCARALVARRWPACRGAIDRLPGIIADGLPCAVNRSLLVARACADRGRVRSAGAVR